MLAMTAAIDWVVEDDHGGSAEAAGPAGTAVMLTIRPLDGRPRVDGEGPVGRRSPIAGPWRQRRDHGYLAACWPRSSA
jgi:hypothetical protein